MRRRSRGAGIAGALTMRLELAVAVILLTAPLHAADLVFEGNGEHLAIPSDRMEVTVSASPVDGAYSLQFRLLAEEARALGQITARLVGQELSVIVCGKEIARPVVRAAITGGVGVISMPAIEDIRLLESQLKGQTPCPVGGGT